MNKIFKFILSGILYFLKYLLDYGLFLVAIYFLFTESWLGSIVGIMLAVAFEYKKYVDFKIIKFNKRPKDILDKVKRGRYNSVNNMYGRTYKREQASERSAYQTGFDAGCDFMLNMEGN